MYIRLLKDSQFKFMKRCIESERRYYLRKLKEEKEKKSIEYDSKILLIEKEINDRFKELVESKKITLTPTLEEQTKRWNLEINDEHDEDILQLKRDELYKKESYLCPKCKIVKPRHEFYHNRAAKNGLNYTCISCDKKYLRLSSLT